MSVIKVNYRVYSTRYHIDKVLKQLAEYDILGFDTETRGVYSKAERSEARTWLKQETLPLEYKRQCLLVADNSGLSYPSLIQVTHFVFGLSESESVIFICDDPSLEYHIWKWVAEYPGLLLIHNTLYDLKIMHHRLGKYPKNYEDTALLAKVFINNVDTWKARVDLKTLMASYYDPAWTLIDGYEPENLKDEKFLRYTAIDGAAVVKLWNDIQEFMNECD